MIRKVLKNLDSYLLLKIKENKRQEEAYIRKEIKTKRNSLLSYKMHNTRF